MVEALNQLKAFMFSILGQIQMQVRKVLSDPKQVIVVSYAILLILVAAALTLLFMICAWIFNKIVKPLLFRK